MFPQKSNKVCSRTLTPGQGDSVSGLGIFMPSYLMASGGDCSSEGGGLPSPFLSLRVLNPHFLLQKEDAGNPSPQLTDLPKFKHALSFFPSRVSMTSVSLSSFWRILAPGCGIHCLSLEDLASWPFAHQPSSFLSAPELANVLSFCSRFHLVSIPLCPPFHMQTS